MLVLCKCEIIDEKWKYRCGSGNVSGARKDVTSFWSYATLRQRNSDEVKIKAH